MTGSNDTGGSRRKRAIAVFAVFVFAFALRQIRADDPIGGFHSFNEAWYSTIATNYADEGSFFFPVTVFGRVDYNVSPLVSYLLYASGNLFGFTESALRLVPILFSSLTVVVIYCLGSMYFGSTGGMASACFYAFAPVSMIAGRNIQTDPVYVFFMLLSLLLYEKAGEKEKRNILLMAVAGFLFGAAFLSKQFAAILLPAVLVREMIRYRVFGWFSAGHVVFGAAALLVPGPFFLYHLYYNSGVVFGAQSTLSASQFTGLSRTVAEYITTEYFWGLSPPLAALSAAGLVYLLFKRTAGGGLILLATIIFNWFLVHWHGHSYYILFATPFLCLAAGALIQAIRPRLLAVAITAAACICAVVLSLAMLCSLKYGHTEFEDISRVMDKQDRPILIVSDRVYSNYHPIIRYYNRDVDIISESQLGSTGMKAANFGPDSPLFFLGYGKSDRERFPDTKFPVQRPALGLFFLGYQVFTGMESEHFFNVVKLRIIKSGGPADNGILVTGRYSSMTLAFAPPGTTVRLKNNAVDFRDSGNLEKSTADVPGAGQQNTH